MRLQKFPCRKWPGQLSKPRGKKKKLLLLREINAGLGALKTEFLKADRTLDRAVNSINGFSLTTPVLLVVGCWKIHILGVLDPTLCPSARGWCL